VCVSVRVCKVFGFWVYRFTGFRVWLAVICECVRACVSRHGEPRDKRLSISIDKKSKWSCIAGWK
jgi:hypothetical protein